MTTPDTPPRPSWACMFTAVLLGVVWGGLILLFVAEKFFTFTVSHGRAVW